MVNKNITRNFCIITTILLISSSTVLAYSNNIEIDEKNNFFPEILADPLALPADWYFKPDSYDELVSWYLELEQDFPNYIEVFKANELYNTEKASGGYDIYYVRITNESLGLHKPEVLFLGSPHGDESAGTICFYWFSDWLMRKAFTDETCKDYSKDYLKWIVDNREIYFEVSHNPYGFDHIQRYDYHGWDLNREADYNGPGSPTGGIWASQQGKALIRFVNNHTIRVGCDFHAGVRMLIYPWASTYTTLKATSLVTGREYTGVPPDFYYYDASSLRLGDYMGDYGGDLNTENVGTVKEHIDYIVKGGIGEWAYGADVERNPLEDPYVKDEKFGNYPGAGIHWVTPELSNVKNVWEEFLGNDTINGFGAEVRRYILHQTDLAQPYIRWMNPHKENTVTITTNDSITVSWQVNGSLVVDHTYLQWGTSPDPKNSYQWNSEDYNQNQGKPLGGTGWDNAEDGKTQGITYKESINFEEPGTYYIVAKAQVDQIYKDIVHPEIYGKNSYLRMIQERTNDSYVEIREGTDGIEEIYGSSWWYSPVLKVIVRENTAPNKPQLSGSAFGVVDTPIKISVNSEDNENDNVYYLIKWGDGSDSGWIGPFESGKEISKTHIYDEKGTYLVKVVSKDIFDYESEESLLPIQMPKQKIKNNILINWLNEFNKEIIIKIIQFIINGV